ncbi:MAG TPA: TonB-dependent receptor, partial [Acidobacteriaceae bacterium]
NVPTLFVASGAEDPHTSKPFQLPGFYDTSPANGGLPFGGPQNTIQYNQDLNLTKGRHNLQFGGQILYIQENAAYGAYAQANEQLGNNQPTGLQNLLTGHLFQFQAAVNPKGTTPCARDPYTGLLVDTSTCQITLPATQPQFARSDRFHDWAGYGQDQWKVTPSLTLNYGVRYEYFGVQHNNNQNLDSNFYYGSGSSLQERVRNGSVLTVPNSPIKELWKPQYGTVSPRLGFAYDVFGNGKTSVRGGYGISYERNFGNVTFNLIQNPPNYAVIVIKPSTQNGVPVPVTNSNVGPLAGGGNLTSVALPPTSLRHVDQNIRTAQTQFHSLSIDQQVGRGSVLELTYNGARGIHLYDIKNYNIPGMGNLYLGDPAGALSPLNPHFSNDNNRGSNGDSYYNALNVQFTTQDIRHSGLSLVANYTYAHALDDLSTTFSETAGSSAFTLGYTDPFNPALDHGNSDFDITHRFVLAPIYRTPYFFKDKGGYVKQLLGGYEVTGIYTLRSGTPFNFYDSTNDSSGYGVPRYNPSSAVTKHTFKSIPSGASSGGANKYTLTSGSGNANAYTLPVDNPFVNPDLGISDLGPYPTTMVGRNSFRGPGAYNLNVSLSKTFPIHERLNFELRAEGFDVTNHHNLYIQETQLDAANYNNIPVPNTDPQQFTNINPQIIASKGGVGNNGGANDERRFLQFAGKINF